jgi:hypothetical protein
MIQQQDDEMLIGQFQKNSQEIVQVIRKRFRSTGTEIIHLKVFSVGGRKCEKGLALNLDQCEYAAYLIQEGMKFQFDALPKKKPARKKASNPDTDYPVVSVNSNSPVPAPAKKVPAKNKQIPKW